MQTKGGKHGERSNLPYMRQTFCNNEAQQEILQFYLQRSGRKSAKDEMARPESAIQCGIYAEISERKEGRLTMDEYIKPCPHCGGSARLTANYSYKIRAFFVFCKCDICGAQAKIYSCKEDPAAAEWNNDTCADAIAAWNMRTPATDEA